VVADLRLAARRLLATPLFTLFAVLSLAFGVAVTTAVYSVVDSIFLRDAGARDPDRVVIVVSLYDGLIVNGSISLPDFQDLRAAQTDGKPRRAVSAQFISVDRAVDSVPPSKPMEYNSNTSAQGGRLVMIAVDSNMASAVHARRCHGARGG
jgi:hypothetical protein